jgi:hypothetical protein
MNRQYLLSGHICIGMGMKSCFFLRFLIVLLQINFKESALSFFSSHSPSREGMGRENLPAAELIFRDFCACAWLDRGTTTMFAPHVSQTPCIDTY